MHIHRRSHLVAALAGVVLAPALPLQAAAHFVLQSPPAMTEQNVIGDPQKAPPCGDAGNAVATGTVTAYQAGDIVKITIDETIFHPGHYRVALAVNDISELPEEPPVTPNNTPCGTAPIQDPPVFPVLADGVFLHDKSFGEPQTIDVKLPDDISCDHCTLQVIQFMSDHGLNNPGGCFYHHCATISVQGAAVESTGGGEETGEGTAGTNVTTMGETGASTVTSASTQGETGGSPTTGQAGDTGGETGGETGGDLTAPTEAAPTSGGGSTATDGNTSGAANEGGEGGCGCVSAGGGGGLAPVFGVFGLLGLRGRRRRAG